MSRRIAIVGGGISGLGAAWALAHHPDRFDFRLYEAQDKIGGNAVTADMPQDNGSSIPFDISVTACIPSVYQHIVLLMKRFGIELIDTRFSLQCEVPRSSVRPRLRLRNQGAASLRDQEVSASPEASAVVRSAEPVAVEVLERPQPIQLHQHGDGSESDRLFRGLPVQSAEANVR